jgi:hypothetical protein
VFVSMPPRYASRLRRQAKKITFFENFFAP